MSEIKDLPRITSIKNLPSYDSNKKLRDEITAIQRELRNAYWDIVYEVGKRLKPEEKEATQREFDELDELLERLKTGLVWLALFGKTGSGKSSVANSLVGSDIAEVSVLKDSTTDVCIFKKDRYAFIDTPGIMGKPNLEQLALDEVQKASAILIVLDDEPCEDELEAIRLIRQKLPHIPIIVFVNKWDRLEQTATEKDRQQVRSRIWEKMAPFVKSQEDIVYGSAMVRGKDPDTGEEIMVRQELPQLVERLYEEAGTLGEIMSLVDPAYRALELNERIREKILEVRIRLARKIINIYGIATVGSGFIPFNQLLMLPGIYASMIFLLFKIMGKTIDRGSADKVASQLLKACAQVLGARFAALVVGDILLDSLFIATGPFGALVGILVTGSALSYFTYNRTVLLGEVAIEFIKNDCTWGAEGQEAVIRRCQQRVSELYFSLQDKIA